MESMTGSKGQNMLFALVQTKIQSFNPEVKYSFFIDERDDYYYYRLSNIFSYDQRIDVIE